jgi:NTP pyrophosphatase (non-canonical NTP hydrolase)
VAGLGVGVVGCATGGRGVTREEIYRLISAEREWQAAKWSGPHHWGSGDCSSPDTPQMVKAAVLAEECGEVSRAVLDRDDAQLHAELVQVAAVAVAWLEGLTPAMDRVTEDAPATAQTVRGHGRPEGVDSE